MLASPLTFGGAAEALSGKVDMPGDDAPWEAEDAAILRTLL